MKAIKLLSLLLIGLSLTFTSCIKDLICIDGEGEILTRTLELDSFSGINSMGAERVIISQGDTQFVEARGHENILDRLETNVSDGVWDIELEREFCYTDYELTIFITVPNIEEVSITGSADIEVNDFIDQEVLDLNITGSGDMELNDFLGCKEFSISISGSGDIDCNGAFDQLTQFDIDIIGSGKINAYEAVTDNCNIEISGSGDCRINVRESLDIDISGSGNIYYKGSPNITTDISGSGDIIDAN